MQTKLDCLQQLLEKNIIKLEKFQEKQEKFANISQALYLKF